MIKKLAVLGMVLCVSTVSFAQKNLMKGAAKAVSSKSSATLGAQVERQLAKQITKYDPVFGYILPEKPVLSYTPDLRTPFHHTGIEEPIAALQVKPIVDKNQIQTAFRMYKDLGDLAQITEMIYLWRLAHPSTNVLPPALEWLATDILKVKRWETYDDKMENLPNIRFLEYLTAWYLPAPSSYAKLVEDINFCPRYIILDHYGFPTKATEAEGTRRLDLYLMLSNPKEMAIYNNAGKYTPFVLTKEEHAAANKLLKIHPELPNNPTPSDMLELAYNRLEMHLVPYSSVKYDKFLRRWTVSADYKAYPNYKNTQLYRSIKELIKSEYPLYALPKTEDLTTHDLDLLHLIVLDAVMGGVEPDNLAEVNMVLNAFDKLLAKTRWTESSERHLTILQANLRIVFNDLIHFNLDHKIDWTDKINLRWFQAMVSDKARFLLLQDVYRIPLYRASGSMCPPALFEF